MLVLALMVRRMLAVHRVLVLVPQLVLVLVLVLVPQLALVTGSREGNPAPVAVLVVAHQLVVAAETLLVVVQTSAPVLG